MTNNERTAAIRRLNDQLRKYHLSGHVTLTSGIRGLNENMITNIIGEIARYEAFTDDNDPYEEHDCAVMVIDGTKVIWKIDYYDKKMTYASPDPADPSVTERVMTIMLAEEY